ncbi:helicase C-terminal domain-containing protein [Thauera sp. Sel9]|uniref:helicase C-terminal domain-containing protein n=1 Tax=Thauera sp. Sel9 TaxID=2974299 RepID=UPI0021E1025A|nr:helicase C-terminal domain-containing protein [Thauera sp. Sel9]MCV2218528.1 hypothetical protein [Thauera sp. Sel9]
MSRFTEQGRGIGFAVLGGVFSEGVDLPGQRLIGAFVVTLGLLRIPTNVTAHTDEGDRCCARASVVFRV